MSRQYCPFSLHGSALGLHRAKRALAEDARRWPTMTTSSSARARPAARWRRGSRKISQQGAAARGRRGQPPLLALAAQLRPADRQSGRQLALRVRARARHRQPRHPRAARQAAGRLERHQRPRLGARPAARLRHLGADGRRGWSWQDVAPLFTRIENFETATAANGRGTGGPLQRLGRARPEPALRRAVQGRRRRRLQAQPRLQQRGPGRRRQDAGQHLQRPAHERGALLSRAGDAALATCTSSPRRRRAAYCSKASAASASSTSRTARRARRAPAARSSCRAGARRHAAAPRTLRHRPARGAEAARHRGEARAAGGRREFPRPHQRPHRLAREGRRASPTTTWRAASAPSPRR